MPTVMLGTLHMMVMIFPKSVTNIDVVRFQFRQNRFFRTEIVPKKMRKLEILPQMKKSL